MQNKKFQYDVKNEMFSGYVFWWSELGQQGLITGFPWKMLYDWPLSGTGSAVPAPCWLQPTCGGSQPTPMVERYVL